MFGLSFLSLNILTEIKLGKISMHHSHMAGKKQKQTPQNQSGCVCDFFLWNLQNLNPPYEDGLVKSHLGNIFHFHDRWNKNAST